MARWLRSCIVMAILILLLLWALASWGYGVVKGLYYRFLADGAEADEAADAGTEGMVNETHNEIRDSDGYNAVVAGGVWAC